MEIDQKLEGEHGGDFDINALLASINSNLEEGLQGSQKDVNNEENSQIKSPKKPQSPQKSSSPQKNDQNFENLKKEEKPESSKGNETQKSNIFTIVRDSPEITEEIDPLLKTLEKIKIVHFWIF